MKAFISALVASMAVSVTTATGQFVPVNLPAPENWIAGTTLFPGRVLKGYNADLSAWDEQGWADHVLDQCKADPDCTGSFVFQAENSGSTGGRYWFGYTFLGGPITASDFIRSTNPTMAVTNSNAQTIV